MRKSKRLNLRASARCAPRELADVIHAHLTLAGFKPAKVLREIDKDAGYVVYRFKVTVPNEPWGAMAVGAEVIIDPKQCDVIVKDYGQRSIGREVEALIRALH